MNVITNIRTYTYVIIFYNAYLSISYLINSIIAFTVKFSPDLKEYVFILEKLKNRGQRKQFKNHLFPHRNNRFPHLIVLVCTPICLYVYIDTYICPYVCILYIYILRHFLHFLVLINNV